MRSFELYRSVLERISEGALTPDAVQDLLARFVRSHGIEYNQRVAEVSGAFFSGAVEAGARYLRELSEAVLPGALPDDGHPPRFDFSDPVRGYQELGEYTMRASLDAAESYRALLQRVAAGEVGPGDLEQSANEQLGRSMPEYVERLGRLYVDLLDGLNEARTEYEEEFLSTVLAAAEAPADDAFALELVGPLGDTAVASLSISNSKDAIARIRCMVTDVRRADGVGPAFSPDVALEPAELELGPGDEADLRVAVTLEPGRYEPSFLYLGAVLVAGHGGSRLEVPLRIMALADQEPATDDGEVAEESA